MTTKIDTLFGQLAIPALARDLLAGEVVTRGATEPYDAAIPTSTADLIFGVLDDINGADISQELPARFMRRGERQCRIRDSITVARYDLLGPSADDPGSLEPVSSPDTACARVLDPITPTGAVNQYTQCEIFCDGVLGTTNAGTASAGVTAVEDAVGFWHLTRLTVASTLPAIAGGAALGVGKSLYTFPAGALVLNPVEFNMDITQTEGNITADTPDVGLGMVIASGVVSVLSGTATFENVLTGQTFADCNGTNTIAMGATPLAVLAADSHELFFNVADTWAAGGDVAAIIAGEVNIMWAYISDGAL